MNVGKKIIMVASLAAVLTSVAFAAPEVMYSDMQGNAALMTVLKPEEDTTVYSRDYLLSCIAAPETEITIYSKNSDGLYYPMVEDETIVSGVVGASGIFTEEITLKRGQDNALLIYAQKGDENQIEYRNITVKAKRARDRVKNFAANIESFISSIFN